MLRGLFYPSELVIIDTVKRVSYHQFVIKPIFTVKFSLSVYLRDKEGYQVLGLVAGHSLSAFSQNT